MVFLSAVFFQYPATATQRIIRQGFTLALYVAGALFIAHFFNFGDVQLDANDWMKEYMYLNALREAQLTQTIPWSWSEPYYHETGKLLANPEMILAPHIVLLRWLSNGSFVILHVIAFYSLGFYSCVKIATRYSMGLVAFFLLWLLFNLNGFITSHLGIGHIQWAGYYLLPAFLLLFSTLHERTRANPMRPQPTSLYISLLLYFLILNGSFHIAIWCMLLMLISVWWDQRLFFNVVYAVVFAIVLGAFRLLPAALFFPESPSFTSGYPNLSVLLNALTCIRGRHHPPMGGAFGDLMWWEYNIHIGFTALILLAIGLFAAIKRRVTLFPAP